MTKNNKEMDKNINDYTQSLSDNFNECVNGYHLINTSPINETIWEDINTLIFTHSGIEVTNQSKGSHLSGMDIRSSIGNISNKSAKYTPNKSNISISSYRLTTVCSNKDCGTPEKFIEEINARKNFDFYSFIIRDETKADEISYDWLFIPSNHPLLDPAAYTWSPTIGKKGKNTGTQVGWQTNVINGCSMSITFSMSSQLWMEIEMTEEIKKHIIATTTVSNKPISNYIELSSLFANRSLATAI